MASLRFRAYVTLTLGLALGGCSGCTSSDSKPDTTAGADAPPRSGAHGTGGPAAAKAPDEKHEKHEKAAVPITWIGWSDDVFEKAQREKKLVLLHLGAVWCHWCHVMEHTTYEDPAVVALVNRAYLAVKVDADSRPDLANRYEDYGWPATILFDSKGAELAKFRGYIEPKLMASRLEAFEKDPTPGPSALGGAATKVDATVTALSPADRAELEDRFRRGYDPEHGGWGRVHKYLDPDSVELALRLAALGDKEAETMALTTLEKQRTHLIDPQWGGVYQYSHGGVWVNPHFEKIMSHQAWNTAIYSLAHAQYEKPEHLQAAKDVIRFVLGFLRHEDGTFYVSMDADLKKGEHAEGYFALPDAERRKLGIPTIDKHVYARENGWAIEALVAVHAASGDPRYLEAALAAAKKMVETRSLEGGGFSHDAKDAAGPYLGDTLAMGRASLALHTVTGDKAWLDRAVAAVKFIEANFRHEVGYLTAKQKGPLASLHQLDENISLARFANLLSHVAEEPAFKKTAEHAFRYCAQPEVVKERRVSSAGTLLAELELRGDPVHVSVIGAKTDPSAKALFQAALRIPTSYKHVEWRDSLPESMGGPAPTDKAAAFVCADNACSPPVHEPRDVAAAVRRFKKP